MPHAQPHAHAVHHTRTPRAHRDAMPMRLPRCAARDAWRARAVEASPPEPERVSAQTVFYVARGVAVLLAAVAVGMSAASDEAEQASTLSSTSLHATPR